MTILYLLKKQSLGILLGVLIITMGYTTVVTNPVQESKLVHLGEVYSEVNDPWNKVYKLKDGAYTYTEADLIYDYRMVVDSSITIGVIDSGITSETWNILETNIFGNVDIVKFVTCQTINGACPSKNEIITATSPNDPIMRDQYSHPHGIQVISVLSALARSVKVIVFDMYDYGTDLGFDLGSSLLWNSVLETALEEDIDIMSISVAKTENFGYNKIIVDAFNRLRANNVFMVAASGNTGSSTTYYPAAFSQFYSIGSIDHEDRPNDNSSPSSKDSRSFFSSYRSGSTETDNNGVMWLMPGNGIPVLIEKPNLEWQYGWGTSFSTPYMAAIVAHLITRYRAAYGANPVDPSISEIVEMLEYGSSASWNVKTGYGVVDFTSAATRAYYLGRVASY